MELKTPYADLLPPLSSEERDALKADIHANGVREAICVDENGVILDGHHRYAICKQYKITCPTRVVKGLCEEEKLAFVIRANLVRRNLSSNQRRELERRTMIPLTKQLRKLDVRKYTQKVIAGMLGVDQSTVSRWLDMPNMQTHNVHKPDARVVIPNSERPKIAAMAKKGKTQPQIAAEYKSNQATISRHLKASKKEEERMWECKARIAKAGKTKRSSTPTSGSTTETTSSPTRST